MKKIYYSSGMKAFYDSSIHSAMPVDAVELTYDSYQDILNGQSIGKHIDSDEDGYPFLIDAPIYPPN